MANSFLWSVLLGATIAAAGANAQKDSRILPIGAPREAGPENSILITDMPSSRLIRVKDLSDSGWEEGAHAPGLSLSWPWHLALDSAGRIYINDRDNARMAGRIYITCVANRGRIVRVDNMDGAGWTTFMPPTSGGNGLKDIALDRQGRIYAADNNNHRIVRFNDMQGTGFVSFGSRGPGIGQFNEPEGLTIDSAGRIYIVDESNHRIVRINDMTGAGWTTFGSYGSGVGQLSLPHDVKLDSLGRIYIADTSNARIVRINSMAGDGWKEFGQIGCSTACTLQVITRLPARGHIAQFFTQLFPMGRGLEGTLELQTNGASVSGVGLRYENSDRTVFTTTPVILLP